MSIYQTAPCSVCERQIIVTSTGHITSHHVFDTDDAECTGTGYYPKGHVLTEGRNTKDQVVHPQANPEMGQYAPLIAQPPDEYTPERVTQAQCQFCRRMVAVNPINGTIEAHAAITGGSLTCKGSGRAWREIIDPMLPLEKAHAEVMGEDLAKMLTEISKPTPFEQSLDEDVRLHNETKALPEDDINHPAHYTWLPEGLEVIQFTELLMFNPGNAVKYIMRAEHKGQQEKDLRKALWYIQRELDRLFPESTQAQGNA